MSKPVVESRGNIFLFTWTEERLCAKISRLSTHSDRTTCEILFETTDPAYHKHLLHTSINLATGVSREKLGRELFRVYGKRLNEEQCRSIIEQLCVITLEQYRTGEPAVELWTNEEVTSASYKVYPLVAENEVNVLFGEGGAGKSYLAMILSILIQLPYENNNLRLGKPQQGKVLWLDWETSQNTARRNIKMLTKGFGLPDLFIKYRRCSQSLPNDLEAIQKICLEDKIDTVIIDSAGLACGGSITKDEFVNPFFTALRSLSVTSLLITHLSKQEMKGKSKKHTPIGSIYFFNMPRNIFEVRSAQEAGANTLPIGVFHTKCNIDKKSAPMAFTLTFAEDEIIVTPDDPKNIPEFASDMSASSQIVQILKDEKKALTREELIEITGLPLNTVKTTLSRLRKRGQTVSLPDNKWGLSYQGNGIH